MKHFTDIRVFETNSNRNKCIAYYNNAEFLGAQIIPHSVSEPNFFCTDSNTVDNFIESNSLSTGYNETIRIPSELTTNK